MQNKWINILLLVIFAGTLFLFGLDKMALTDPDEPFYAESAREMLTRAEWLTPRIFSEPQFEKPPMYYWLVVISYKMFGVNEFSARFPSALFGILGILGIYYIGVLLFRSQRAGMLAALVMATSIEYIILSRACVTDIVLCVFILYTFLFYLRGYYKNHNKLSYIVASLFCALAVLTKGPVGLVLPMFIIFLFLLIKKDLKAIFKYTWIESIFLFSIVAIPWFYIMTKVYGSAFTDHFFGHQNVTRFLTPEHTSSDIALYYVPILLGGFMPWALFLIPAVSYAYKKDKVNIGKYLFLFLWVVVFFVFFSISRTKLPTYIFPLFPALAILVGRYLDLSFDIEGLSKYEKTAGVLFSALFPISIIVGVIVSNTKYPLMGMPIIISGTIMFLLSTITLVFVFRNRKVPFYSSIFCMMVLCLFCLTVFLSEPITIYETSKRYCDEIKQRMSPGELVAGEDDYRRGIAFYMQQEKVVDLHDYNNLKKFLSSKDRVWGIIKQKHLVNLYSDGKTFIPLYTVYRAGKRIVVTNKKPQTGEYIQTR